MQANLRIFFDTHVTKSLSAHSFLLLREDGHIIFKKSNVEKYSHEVGALVAGLSQAASALCKFLNPDETDFFRFSSESGEKGFYIIPVFIKENQYFLTLIFNAETNPSLMKMEARNLARNLEQVEFKT